MNNFHTLLIANRGEIARRIITTAKRLGIKTIAVYSDIDVEALHVREADQAIYIGPAESSSSYSNIDVILDACVRTEAQAVHPGYGFLAENADFARAVQEAGLLFVGPSAQVIDLMGNKSRAKEAMQQAGVGVVPGGLVREARDVEALAEEVGYPLMFKATAGGGGRGMRIALNEKELMSSYEAAKSEALSSFGSDEIIIERVIQEARHIEVQIFSDQQGNCIHLGERDCSMQRRFQKVVEEAPSPVVSAELRAQMGAVACAAAQSIGYVGAGTIEFLLDKNNNFYFMEMNTRLQVEHGVTELVTGLDLVELQLQIARGESLSIKQEEVVFKGHAMELRVCAEDPQAQFLPQVGRIALWQPSTYIRVDSSVEKGTEISPFYDSMIAKFMAHAPSREEVIRKLTYACSTSALLGVKNNIDFLSQLINHPVFLSGKGTVNFLSNEDLSTDYWHQNPSEGALLAAVFVLNGLCTEPPFQRANSEFERQCTQQLRATHIIDIEHSQNGSSVKTQYVIAPKGNGHKVTAFSTDDAEQYFHVDYSYEKDHEVVIVVDGVREKYKFARANQAGLWIQDGSAAWYIQRAQTDKKKNDVVDGMVLLRAPMTGKVISIEVAMGDAVQAEQALLVVESMKMEVPLSISVNGVVSEIDVEVGQQISAGQILMEIEHNE